MRSRTAALLVRPRPYSGREWGGALSDALLVPFADAMLLPLAPHVPAWVAAAASDNVVDGFRAVAEPLRQRPPESVLVWEVARGLPEVLALMANASLPLERVLTARARWDEAPEAWLAPSTKLVIER